MVCRVPPELTVLLLLYRLLDGTHMQILECYHPARREDAVESHKLGPRL